MAASMSYLISGVGTTKDSNMGASARGGGILIIMHGRSRLTIYSRIPAETEHVGFSRTRQTLLALSVKRGEVLGKSHEG